MAKTKIQQNEVNENLEPQENQVDQTPEIKETLEFPKIGDIIEENGKPIVKGCKFINGKYFYTDNEGKVIVIV